MLRQTCKATRQCLFFVKSFIFEVSAYFLHYFSYFEGLSMLKKRLLTIGGLLVVCIAGQVLLRPCMGESTATDTTAPVACEGIPAGANPPQPADRLNDDASGLQSTLIRQFVLMLSGVAIIGAGAWFVCRKFGGGLAGGQGVIRVSDTVRMGPRKAVHLVRVGQRAFLVGSGQDSFTLLAEVSDSVDKVQDGGK